MKVCRNCKKSLFADQKRCPNHDHLVPIEERTLPYLGQAPLLGSVLHNDYEVVDLIEIGPKVVVYRGIHQPTNRQVSIAVLSETCSDRARQRLLREARVLSEIQNQHTARLIAFGRVAHCSWREVPYVVMQLIDGEPLVERLSRGRLSLVDVRTVIDDVTSALAEAHEHAVVHRHLRPSNIVLASRTGERMRAYVTDFCVARTGGTPMLTKSDPSVGTFEYAAPEQLFDYPSGTMDPRVDVYALGMILCEMLTGFRPTPCLPTVADCDPRCPVVEHPLLAGTYDDEIIGHCRSVVAKALSTNPDDRYSDVLALRVDFIHALRQGVTTRAADSANCAMATTKVTPMPADRVERAFTRVSARKNAISVQPGGAARGRAAKGVGSESALVDKSAAVTVSLRGPHVASQRSSKRRPEVARTQERTCGRSDSTYIDWEQSDGMETRVVPWCGGDPDATRSMRPDSVAAHPTSHQPETPRSPAPPEWAPSPERSHPHAPSSPTCQTQGLNHPMPDVERDDESTRLFPRQDLAEIAMQHAERIAKLGLLAKSVLANARASEAKAGNSDPLKTQELATFPDGGPSLTDDPLSNMLRTTPLKLDPSQEDPTFGRATADASALTLSRWSHLRAAVWPGLAMLGTALAMVWLIASSGSPNLATHPPRPSVEQSMPSVAVPLKTQTTPHYSEWRVDHGAS